MGFLRRGEQSRRSRANKSQTPSTASSASTPSNSVSTPSVPPPTPESSSSWLERLPVELLQYIFFESYNPNLALCNRYLINTLSSPYMRTAMLRSVIVDGSLPKEEYKVAMSGLISRRFFTLPLMRQVESSLWERHFRDRLMADYPGARPCPLAVMTSFDTWPTNDPVPWTLSMPPPVDHKDEDGGYSHLLTWAENNPIYIPALKYRVAWQMLDLRTITFPKHRFLLPPYTPAKMQFLREVSRRMPAFWAGVNLEDRGVWCARALEIAIRKRCAAMVYLLLSYFHVDLDVSLIRLAVMPPDVGDTQRLEPELSQQEDAVSRHDDYKMLRMFKSPTYPDDPQIASVGWLREVMLEWRNGGGRLEKAGWPRHSPIIEDWVWVLFVMDLVASGGKSVAERSLRYPPSQPAPESFPVKVAGTMILHDEEVWQQAARDGGPLMEWLMVLGRPPADFFVMVLGHLSDG